MHTSVPPPSPPPTHTPGMCATHSQDSYVYRSKSTLLRICTEMIHMIFRNEVLSQNSFDMN